MQVRAFKKVESAVKVLKYLPKNISAEMREIVHIQAGQCGNQIGAKVS